MVDTSMVGQDVGSPAQNPVPQKPRPYQQDPFSGEDLAQVSYGGGRQQTVSGAGFRTPKPKYMTDPFTSDFNPNNIKKPDFYTDQDWKELGSYQQYFQKEEDPTDPAAPSDTPFAYENEYGGVAPVGGDVIDPYTGENLGPSFVQGVEGKPGEVSSVTVGNQDFGYQETFNEDNATQDVLNKIAGGVDPEAAAWEAGFPEEEKGWLDKGKDLANQGLEYAEGYLQPKQEETTWGDKMTTSAGGAVGLALPGGFGVLAGIGGAISKKNLENIYAEHGEYNADKGVGLMPVGTIPGVNTPLAVSPGFIPGTEVVSGATDLIPPQYDLDGDGQFTVSELKAMNDPNSAGRQAYAQWETNKNTADTGAQEQTGFAHATAVTDANGNPVKDGSGNIVVNIPSQYKDQYAVHKQQQEAKQKAEAAAKKAAEEAAAKKKAEEAAAAAAAAAAQQEKDNNPPPVAVTSGHYSQKNVDDQVYGEGAYKESNQGSQSGQYYSSGHDWSAPKQDNDSGGGGGGDSCFAKGTTFKMADGTLKAIQDIKVGDIMEKGGRVYGVLQGDGSICDWYRYGDSYVTGSHFVKERGKWMPVWKSKKAEAMLFDGFDVWYCVLNVKHLMVAGDKSVFTDFDAVDSVNEELEERLNAIQKR